MKLRLIILLFVVMSVSFQSQHAQCSSLNYKCYISNEFPYKNSNAKPIFQSSEKIYIYVMITDMPPGSYLFGTNWLKYTGATERHKFTEVKINHTTDYTYYSWFKLVEKGPVSQMFMGDEYDHDQRGKRKVVVTIDGEKICEEFFELL